MFGITSLRGKTKTLFAAFFLLLAISVGVNYWGITAQKSDALVINLAGRQRMLTQQMTWLALNRPGSPELPDSITRFEQTLKALRDGGPALHVDSEPVTLTPAPDEELRRQLDWVLESWESFKAKIAILNSLPIADPSYAQVSDEFQAESFRIVDQLDKLVGAYEVRAQAKVLQLLWIQGGFLAAALGLLVWGFRLIHLQIDVPLTALSKSARRIGFGDLQNPVPHFPEDELSDLSHALETMQKELAAANHSLEERVNKRTQELTAAFELSQEIIAQLDLAHLLQSVTERAKTLGLADSAALCLLNPEKDYLELASYHGGIWEQPGLKQSIRQGMAAQVIGESHTVIAKSALANCSFLKAQGPGNCLATPLRVGEQTLGAMCLLRKEGGAFDQDEVRALSLLANSAAIAIANARLNAARHRDIQYTAAVAERERLAEELHDNLVQTLGYLRMKVENMEEAFQKNQTSQALETLGRIKSTLEQVYTQAREALRDLHHPPPALENLARQLAECAAEFQDLSGIPVEIDIENPAALELSPVVQAQVMHILRSALANIHRHAHAHQVSLRAEFRESAAWFTVADDGVGFEPALLSEGDHLGLEIMRARAERSGGNLTVESTPQIGTKVVVCFPLSP